MYAGLLVVVLHLFCAHADVEMKPSIQHSFVPPFNASQRYDLFGNAERDEGTVVLTRDTEVR